MSPPARRRRAPASRQLLGRLVLGAGTGALAGGAAVWLAGLPPGWPAWPVVTVLALLGAALGVRYGRRVVRATADAFLEASD